MTDKPKTSPLQPRRVANWTARQSEGVEPRVTLVPTVQAIISDAYAVLGDEIKRLKNKAARDGGLDLRQAKALVEYMRALTAIAREEREQQAQDRLDQASDAELLELAKGAENILRLNSGESEEDS